MARDLSLICLGYHCETHADPFARKLVLKYIEARGQVQWSYASVKTA